MNTPSDSALNAVRAALDALDTGQAQIARDNLRILEIHLRANDASRGGADERPVAWWNGIGEDWSERSPYGPSIRWGADAENSAHDIPLYAGYNPVNWQKPQPAAAGELPEAHRKAFERWIGKRWGYSTDVWADSGNYKSNLTRDWWECWQAASAAVAECRRDAERYRLIRAAELTKGFYGMTEKEYDEWIDLQEAGR